MESSSVVLPTIVKNLYQLKITIKSVLNEISTFKGSELIVVDNRNKSLWDSELKTFCTLLGSKVVYLHETSIGSTAARHRGVMIAKNEILTFVDDDIIPSTGWYKNILNLFHEKKVSLAFGPSLPILNAKIPSWVNGFFEATPYGGWLMPTLSLLKFNIEEGTANPIYAWTLNYSIRKDLFLEVKGLNVEMAAAPYEMWQGNGEYGLALKLIDIGVFAFYSNDLLIFHDLPKDRLTLSYFCKRSYRQGIEDAYTQARLNTRLTTVYSQKKSHVKSFLNRIWNLRILFIIHKSPTDFSKSWNFFVYYYFIKIYYYLGLLKYKKAICQNPEIKNWNQRDNYLDANIPNNDVS